MLLLPNNHNSKLIITHIILISKPYACNNVTKTEPLCKPPLPPTPHCREERNVHQWHESSTRAGRRLGPLRAQKGRNISSSRVSVLSVLPDVSAEHTLEMIPKSMILAAVGEASWLVKNVQKLNLVLYFYLLKNKNKC